MKFQTNGKSKILTDIGFAIQRTRVLRGLRATTPLETRTQTTRTRVGARDRSLDAR